jgi:hypothetical protein
MKYTNRFVTNLQIWVNMALNTSQGKLTKVKKPFNNFGITFRTNCVIRTGNA